MHLKLKKLPKRQSESNKNRLTTEKSTKNRSNSFRQKDVVQDKKI